MFRIISPSLSPNTEQDDVRLAWDTLMSPHVWKEGEACNHVESWFRNYFQTDTVVSCNSGRSALMLLLQAFGIEKGDEVVVQAFTCVAVPEVVMWVGATPVYGDIEASTYNIDPSKLEQVITAKTKAVIVQHTFGIPAPMTDILSVARKHNLIVIEDCAHSLGALIGKQKIGSFGDASIFSFGRDKVVSSVFGGVAMLNKTSRVTKHVISTVHKKHEAFPYPSDGWIFQQLLHPVIMNIFVIPLYNILSLGKLILVICQKLKLLSFPVLPEEAEGKRPALFPGRMPNGLAILAHHQLKKLYRYNVKRQLIARQYGPVVPGAIYLRYPVCVSHPSDLVYRAKRTGIFLGRWYSNVIDPSWVHLSSVGYTKGMCPEAENVSREIVNLPTYPRMNQKDVSSVKHLLNHEHH